MSDPPLIADIYRSAVAVAWEKLLLLDMTMRAQRLASGPGWSVSEILCSAGPCDRRFEEQHDAVCIAAVMEGSFQYRSTQGAATLVPGAVLLGNHRSCFECGHDHGTGDRCLSFMFEPGFFESIASSIPSTRQSAFRLPRLPPLMSLMPILAAAERAGLEQDCGWFEQIALDLAGSAVALAAASGGLEPPTNRRDGRRITAALRRIGNDSAAELSIADLAREAAMSPYHFLRIFRRVVGMTPHQYVLRTRVQNAALWLRDSSRPVLDIALEAGFGDLSTFNRRFRLTMGATPSEYRRGRQRSADAAPLPCSPQRR
jgi:AraC family transcriptional regulator